MKNRTPVLSPKGKKNDIIMEEQKEALEESESEQSEDDSEYKNQFKQIYPSKRNTEEEYDNYMAHAQKLYERFTGSYSKKTQEEPPK